MSIKRVGDTRAGGVVRIRNVKRNIHNSDSVSVWIPQSWGEKIKFLERSDLKESK